MLKPAHYRPVNGGLHRGGCRRNVWPALLIMLLAGCAPYGDGAAYARQARRQAEQRAAEMAQATRQHPRGSPLQGSVLQQALSGQTLHYRYGRFPNGDHGDYRLYRYFAADGGYQERDNWLQADAAAADSRWRIEDARLCVLHRYISQDEHCYRVELRSDGRLQFYVDDPGSRYHGLLTTINDGQSSGPPPALASVLVSPPP